MTQLFNTDEIRQRNPLRETIEHLTGAQFRKVGTWWTAKCMLHDDRGPSLNIKGDADHYHCFGCPPETAHGDVIKFVMNLKQVDFKEACELLGGHLDANPIEMDAIRKARLEEEQRRQDEEAAALATRREQFAKSGLWKQYHDRLDKPAIEWWWNETRLEKDWLDYWSLGVIPDLWGNGRAYTIPYRSTTGAYTTIQYRFASPNGLGKYRFEPELGATAFIARPDQKCSRILVVEGAKKAMVAHAFGVEGWQVIGIPSENNLGDGTDEILKAAKAIVWWPDPGDNAWAYMKKFITALGIAAIVRVLKTHMKPDDMILEGASVARLMSQARPIGHK